MKDPVIGNGIRISQLMPSWRHSGISHQIELEGQGLDIELTFIRKCVDIGLKEIEYSLILDSGVI